MRQLRKKRKKSPENKDMEMCDLNDRIQDHSSAKKHSELQYKKERQFDELRNKNQ